MSVRGPSRQEILEAHRAYGPDQRALTFARADTSLIALLARRGKSAGASRLQVPVADVVEAIQGMLVTRSLYEDILSELYNPPTTLITTSAADTPSIRASTITTSIATSSVAAAATPSLTTIPIHSTSLHTLLHQQASYFCMLVTDADTAFQALLDKWWNLEDLVDMHALEERNRYWIDSDESCAWKALLNQHELSVHRIRDDAGIRAVVSSEGASRDVIHDQEEYGRHALGNLMYKEAKVIQQRELLLQRSTQSAEQQRSSSAPICGGVTIEGVHDRSFKVSPPTAITLSHRGTSLQHHTPTAPPTSRGDNAARPSRMAQYKEGRRFRQDVDYRTTLLEGKQKALDAAAAEAEAVAIHGVQSRPPVRGVLDGGGITGMVASFSSPPGWDDIVLGLVQREHGMRGTLQSTRYQWVRAVGEAHRKYLDACALGRPMGILMREETAQRRSLQGQYFAMLLEFTEVLETLHRQEIVRSIAPKAARSIQSSENTHWLFTRRRDNAKKDEEDRKGAEDDFKRRGEHFLWEREMLSVRLSLGKEETFARTNTVIKAQRKDMSVIADLFDLELPLVLRRIHLREAREWEASTNVTWTPASYKEVYLGEADGRDGITAQQTLESHRLHQKEVKAFLSARRQELISSDVLSKMAEYDQRSFRI